jgi:hypothetical protein
MNETNQLSEKWHYIPLLILLSVLGIFILPQAVYAQYSKEITITFEAKWDGPVLTIFLGKLGGYLPGQFTFQESAWKDRRRREEFFMALDDDGGKAWARFHSDTSKESAVWLPRKQKEVLNAEVIRFIRTLRRMFKDTSRHSMNDVFTFGSKKLFAQAGEYALSADETQKFGFARAFNILTFDSMGTPGIRGRVVVVKDSVLHYRKVSIFLPEDEIEATLEKLKEK